ncbi:hypothetical protein [Arthrobacter bambusae]|uniref:hypothetical protein n=1 Tax=Arthrobacter bambusae TaxID=1338426 RepID=UPI002781C676|nr:hypothetical protein [Arthrobacter bambusae]MDQ0212044.1 hypothetical protein [Arthrobacter bambusae]MDQ0236709.1 hypothetical protein [Arthrobacter bambusae]
MKWYRWVHQVIFAASLAPLWMGVWDVSLLVLLPLLVLIPYGTNEVILHRRERAARARAAGLYCSDPMVHAYRE